MVQRILYTGESIHSVRVISKESLFSFPFVAISIALTINKQVEIGVIYNPVLDRLYSARRGKGAFRNGRPIKCSGQTGYSKTKARRK